MDTIPSKSTNPWPAPGNSRRRATGDSILRVMLRYVIPVAILLVIAVGMITG